MNKKEKIELPSKYFKLTNYKESYLCSWFEDEPDFYNQKVYYIGVTNGLGGYRQMLSKGFIDKRFVEKYVFKNKVMEYYEQKRKKQIKRTINRKIL